MIEKLKLEPYIPESLVVHLYSEGGHLVAERYDTIYWVREEFLNVSSDVSDCYVDAKLFCTFAQSVKSVLDGDGVIRLVLFNQAEYELSKVKEEVIPHFDIPELPYKSSFDFGGVESAVSKSPLQKDLNMVYVDEDGCVASDSIVAGISSKFKSATPFSVPEGIPSMVGKDEVEWGLFDGKLIVSAGCYKIVAVLSKSQSDFDWWTPTRGSFEGLPTFIDISGFKSSVSRLANFGSLVSIQGNRISVNSEHWEPFPLEGDGEVFDVSNLGTIAIDDKCGVALHNGNLYLKTHDATFVCCSVDLESATQESEEY